ncbi:hypothetical protein PMIN02_006094 [Paraphaeosphaeria minitans]
MRSEQKYTQLYSFSDTDAVGVETITDIDDISVPSSALVETYPHAKSDFNAYQFVITAGEEKLPKVTTGGAASTGGPASTGTDGTGTGSEGAAPMKTLAPALDGLGAAVAWFL